MLIEALVSILIFSIGVLALVGLQAKMTTAQTSSKIRTDAAYMANELIGVMWSDIKNVSTYDKCASDPCKDWNAKLAQSLPSATSTIAVDATNLVTISITWKQGSGDTHTYTTSTYVRAAS